MSTIEADSDGTDTVMTQQVLTEVHRYCLNTSLAGRELQHLRLSLVYNSLIAKGVTLMTEQRALTNRKDDKHPNRKIGHLQKKNHKWLTGI